MSSDPVYAPDTGMILEEGTINVRIYKMIKAEKRRRNMFDMTMRNMIERQKTKQRFGAKVMTKSMDDICQRTENEVFATKGNLF